MREIPPPNVVATRHDHVGRFALFHSPGPSLFAPIPWRAVNLEQGTDDSVTIQVRLDEHDDPGAAAWTARDLVRVAFGRQVSELARSGDAFARLSAFHLTVALGQLQRRRGLPPAPVISVTPGPYSSAYPWSAASIDGVGTIRLSPDPLGDGEGVTPELLLHVLDRLLGDAALGIRADAYLHAAANHAGAALTADALDWAMIKRWSISSKIQAIAAATEAGRKAKAQVAIALIEENRNFAGMDGDIQFAYSVLLDVVGGEG